MFIASRPQLPLALHLGGGGGRGGDGQHIPAPLSTCRAIQGQYSIHSSHKQILLVFFKPGHESFNKCAVDLLAPWQGFPPDCPPTQFTPADLIRSVNKKVRHNYIRRRLKVNRLQNVHNVAKFKFTIRHSAPSACTDCLQ